MPESSKFAVEETIKGKINRRDFNANLVKLDKKRFPRDFVSGRKYIVFFKPNEESKAMLADPRKRFTVETEMHAEELVAIIDVSKPRIEAESENIKAHKKGKYADFTFTPDKWNKLRQSKRIDLAEQESFIPFITHVVVHDKATIAHVRSYLGEPDFRYTNEDGICYEYRLNISAPTPNGTISGGLELYFEPDTTLRGYYVKYYKHIEEPAKGREASEPSRFRRELNSEELRELGLTAIDRYEP